MSASSVLVLPDSLFFLLLLLPLFTQRHHASERLESEKRKSKGGGMNWKERLHGQNEIKETEIGRESTYFFTLLEIIFFAD